MIAKISLKYNINGITPIKNSFYFLNQDNKDYMKQSTHLVLPIFVALFFFQSCSDKTVGPELVNEIEDAVDDENKIFITDRTGKKWDVTHAKEKYGMEPEKFQFGLGPNAIRPIILAKMLSPGDQGYPISSLSFLVMATNILGDTRAYPISTMSQHEVANEVFGDAHVAVAY